jgi:hypothetical protein
LLQDSPPTTATDIQDIEDIEDFDTQGSDDAEGHAIPVTNPLKEPGTPTQTSQDNSCAEVSQSSIINHSPSTPRYATNDEQSSQNYIPPNLSQPITDSIEEVISMETAAAKKLFSPGFKKASHVSRRPWTCTECGVVNDVSVEDCDGCLATRPDNISMEMAEPGIVKLCQEISLLDKFFQPKH